MSTVGGLRTRNIKKIDPPRPLKSSVAKHAVSEPVNKSNIDSVEQLLFLMDSVIANIKLDNFDTTLTNNIITLCSKLKQYGPMMEDSPYQSQLDECFSMFREALIKGKLPYAARFHLLELVERRWKNDDSDIQLYYQSRGSHIQTGSSSDNYEQILDTASLQCSPSFSNVSELVKRSGKYPKPVKLPGKNYFKDEFIINNSDSGKVMGIKGRRIHMIEQLSETIISFQRVQPTAKERSIQITGGSEDHIKYAAYLIDETIRNNTSPIPDYTGSNCSLDSVEFEEDQKRFEITNVLPDIELKSEYKHKVNVNGAELVITGDNYSYVLTAKTVLDDFFSKCIISSDFGISESSKGDMLNMQFDLPDLISTDFLTTDQSLEEFNKAVILENEFHRSNSNDDDTIDADSPGRDDYIRHYKYDTTFLQRCSKLPLSNQDPPNWDQVVAKFSTFIKEKA